MANKPFSKIGGFFKSQTDPESPEAKIYALEKNINALAQKQNKLYTDIGKIAVQKYGYAEFAEAGAELEGLDKEAAEMNALMQSYQEEIEKRQAAAAAAREAAANAAAASLVCSSCGAQNPEGYRFCQECGTKLEAPAKSFCGECGAELVAGARFCGACGAKQPEVEA